jgi:hypothetical protein
MRQIQFDCAWKGNRLEKILDLLPTRPNLDGDRTSDGTVKLFPNVHIDEFVWTDHLEQSRDFGTVHEVQDAVNSKQESLFQGALLSEERIWRS